VLNKKGILRTIDVNFNRSKEGLRVIEDIFRFTFDDDILRRKIRKVRHALDALTKGKAIKEAILSRDSINDLGKHIDSLEIKRTSVLNTLYINFQRVKESLRVLEEFFKLIIPKKVAIIKKQRYIIYVLEQKALKKWSPLYNARCRR
jgi:thiamine-phosphate pyrophosphorylase